MQFIFYYVSTLLVNENIISLTICFNTFNKAYSNTIISFNLHFSTSVKYIPIISFRIFIFMKANTNDRFIYR